MSATQNADERGFQQVKKIPDSVFFSVSYLFCGQYIFFICVKIDRPDDQNQDIFFPGLKSKNKLNNYIVEYSRVTVPSHPQVLLTVADTVPLDRSA